MSSVRRVVKQRASGWCVLWSLLPICAPAAYGAVVINELMYHPPEDSDGLQYIEIHNSSDASIDLSGWYFEKGIRFEFPDETVLNAEGFLVICKNAASFGAHYGQGIEVIGEFSGRLSHNGERVRLVDSAGQLVDEIRYGDRDEWPRGADGYGASLERISLHRSGQEGSDWGSSRLPRWKESQGTPGRQNDSFSPIRLPRVHGVKMTPTWPSKNEPVEVSANLSHPPGIQGARLRYRVAQTRQEGEVIDVPMTIENGRAFAQIPGVSEGSLVRFQLIIEGRNDAKRTFPSEESPRPALSYYVGGAPKIDHVGHGLLMNIGTVERGVDKFHRARLGRKEQVPSRGTSAFVYFSGADTTPQLYDFIRVTQRNGGFKLRFHPDEPFDGMTVLNVLYEGNSRYLLSEYLAYELYRRADVPAPKAGHLRLTIDGRSAGHFLTVEQPNRSFLKRHDRDPNGNLYKILWFGRGVVDQHEKKTNRHEGHDDLLRVLAGLRRLTDGDQQWRFIQQHFNVEEFASYYAVNMCISNWDGFFNNYFTYHDIDDTGRWEIYPWDEDKTWGYYDGGPGDCSWYSFPLTSGMSGDRSPSRGLSFFNRGPFGGVSWWRPPGHFSGPLLANASFRQHFLQRLETLCHGVFTEPQFGPVIDALEKRLLPEVSNRARVRRRDVGRAEQEFREQIESFRQQLKHRRTFILRELAKG